MALLLLYIKPFTALTAVYGTRNLLLDSCRKRERREGEGRGRGERTREEQSLFLNECGDETACKRKLGPNKV